MMGLILRLSFHGRAHHTDLFLDMADQGYRELDLRSMFSMIQQLGTLSIFP